MKCFIFLGPLQVCRRILFILGKAEPSFRQDRSNKSPLQAYPSRKLVLCRVCQFSYWKKAKQPKGKHLCQRLCYGDTPPAPKGLGRRSRALENAVKGPPSWFLWVISASRARQQLFGVEPKQFYFLGLCPMPWGCIAVRAAFKSLSFTHLFGKSCAVLVTGEMIFLLSCFAYSFCYLMLPENWRLSWL